MKEDIKAGRKVNVDATTRPKFDKRDKKVNAKTIKPKKETDTGKKKKPETSAKPIVPRLKPMSDSKYNELKELIIKLERRVATLETTFKKK
jgi:hypothetical protein